MSFVINEKLWIKLKTFKAGSQTLYPTVLGYFSVEHQFFYEQEIK